MAWRIEILIFAAVVGLAYADMTSRGLDKVTALFTVSQKGAL